MNYFCRYNCDIYQVDRMNTHVLMTFSKVYKVLVNTYWMYILIFKFIHLG